MSLTKQQLFNNAYFGVVKQGKKSLGACRSGPHCAYRAEDGSKCGIGHSIPDEVYSPAFEGHSITNLLDEGERTKPMDDLFLQEYQFCIEIQRVHDGMNENPRTFIPEFMARMTELANKHNLRIPSIVQEQA